MACNYYNIEGAPSIDVEWLEWVNGGQYLDPHENWVLSLTATEFST